MCITFDSDKHSMISPGIFEGVAFAGLYHGALGLAITRLYRGPLLAGVVIYAIKGIFDRMIVNQYMFKPDERTRRHLILELGAVRSILICATSIALVRAKVFAVQEAFVATGGFVLVQLSALWLEETKGNPTRWKLVNSRLNSYRAYFVGY